MSKRLRFFAAHLGISFLVLSLAALVIFLVWYPHPLAAITGVIPIFLMLLVIDVVLGPAMSLLVYKEGKKTLKTDLTVIILIQLAAFIYGFYSIATTRPAWIVFHNNGFDLVRVSQLDSEHLSDATNEFKQAGWFGPRYAAVLMPNDARQRNQDMFDALNGRPPSLKADRYVPVSLAAKEIRATAKDLSILYNYNHKADVEPLLKQYPAVNAWLPLYKGQRDKVVLINREKAEVVQVVDLKANDLKVKEAGQMPGFLCAREI